MNFTHRLPNVPRRAVFQRGVHTQQSRLLALANMNADPMQQLTAHVFAKKTKQKKHNAVTLLLLRGSERLERQETCMMEPCFVFLFA